MATGLTSAQKQAWIVPPVPVARPEARLSDVEWQRWFALMAETLRRATSTGRVQTAVVTTGFVVTVADGYGCVQLLPAAALSAGLIHLPGKTLDGATVCIASTQSVTALTVTADGVTPVNGGAVSLVANTQVIFRFIADAGAWYRVQ